MRPASTGRNTYGAQRAAEGRRAAIAGAEAERNWAGWRLHDFFHPNEAEQQRQAEQGPRKTDDEQS